MSINMDNPQSLSEKLDALTNLIEQMYLAHRVHDELHFLMAHKQAAKLGFDLQRMIETDEE